MKYSTRPGPPKCVTRAAIRPGRSAKSPSPPTRDDGTERYRADLGWALLSQQPDPFFGHHRRHVANTGRRRARLCSGRSDLGRRRYRRLAVPRSGRGARSRSPIGSPALAWCWDMPDRPGPAAPNSEINQFYSLHGAGVNFLFADGHVEFLPTSLDGAVYQALATRAQAEPVSRNAN